MNKTLTLKTRIFLGYLLPMALMVALSISTYLSMVNIRDLADQVTAQRKAVTATQGMATLLERVRATVRGYILTGQDQQRQQVMAMRADIDALRQKMGEGADTSEEQQLLQRIDVARKKLDAHNDEEIVLIQAGKFKECVDLVKTGVGGVIGKELVSAFDPFLGLQQKQLDDLVQRQRDELARMVQTVVVATGLALALALGIGSLVVSRIARSISEAIAGMTVSTAQIAATVDEHDRTASQQAAAVTQTTATVEELGASSRMSSDQAESTAASARQAFDSASQGKLLAEQVVQSMSDMQSKVGTVAEQIARLSEHAAQIGGISRVVGELASETNMLALNAAVEAARAGEHGKGFAVVASEVRKLAEQSKKSAERANVLVMEIQRATNSAVMVAEDGTRTASEAASKTMLALDAFEDISSAASNVSMSTQQLLLNSKQQAIALNQVTEAMKSLSAGAVQIAAGTQQTQQGVNKLNHIALGLKAMV